MSNKNLIVERINFRIILFYFYRFKIFYLKDNIYSKLLKKFNIKKLDWNIKDEINSENNLVQSFFEKNKIGHLIEDFFNDEIVFFNNLNSEDCFYFKEYLKVHLPSEKYCFGKLSLKEFLIVIDQVNKLIKENKTFFFEQNIFSQFISKKFKDENCNFIFFNSLRFLTRFDLIKLFLKNLKYLKKNKKNNLDKKLCIIDSYQINKPHELIDDNTLFEKTVFCSHHYYDKSIKCIMDGLSLKLYFNIFKKNLKIFFSLKKYFLKFFYFEYILYKEIYYNFFKSNNIKVFMSSSISKNYIVSANAASKKLGLHSVGFTCSLNTYYNDELGIKSFDTFINFSPLHKELKKKSINYKNFGYIGDYKFQNILNSGKAIRNQLNQNSIKFVIGFFDQGFSNDKRFGLTFSDAQVHGYAFLLNKVIQNEDLGLLIKPKKPKILTKILNEKFSEINKLLNQAIKTQRCIIFDNHDPKHVKNFIDIPAKIAEASDMTIHDTMLAGTAGLESALMNKRSLLFDYYNSSQNFIFKNKDLNIVFDDWDKLWDELMNFRKNNKKSNLGDWSSILKYFDEFNDGKTNKRLQNFLNSKI
mgnify:FL=1|tara:strand:- start:5320 stop:7071 length:1752 start_codon:yes stop_codon:yes gene_type:complete